LWRLSGREELEQSGADYWSGFGGIAAVVVDLAAALLFEEEKAGQEEGRSEDISDLENDENGNQQAGRDVLQQQALEQQPGQQRLAAGPAEDEAGGRPQNRKAAHKAPHHGRGRRAHRRNQRTAIQTQRRQG